MKVLAAARNYWGPRSMSDHTEAQLVIWDLCAECNPTRSDFRGLDDGDWAGEAVVIERPDLDRSAYEALLYAALDRFLEYAPWGRDILKSRTRELANELLDVADSYAEGTVVTHQFGRYGIATLDQKAS